MSKVKIVNMRTKGVTGSLKAFCTVDLGPISVDDCRLIKGSQGWFVAMPSKRVELNGDTKFFDIVKFARDSNGNLTPSADKLRQQILDEALAEYEFRTKEVVTTGATSEEDDDLPF